MHVDVNSIECPQSKGLKYAHFWKRIVQEIQKVVSTCSQIMCFVFSVSPQAFLHRIRQTADDQQCLSPEHVKVGRASVLFWK